MRMFWDDSLMIFNVQEASLTDPHLPDNGEEAFEIPELQECSVSANLNTPLSFVLTGFLKVIFQILPQSPFGFETEFKYNMAMNLSESTSKKSFLLCRSSFYKELRMLTQLREIQNSQNGSTLFS